MNKKTFKVIHEIFTKVFEDIIVLGTEKSAFPTLENEQWYINGVISSRIELANWLKGLKKG